MAAGDSGCEAYTAIAWGVGLTAGKSANKAEQSAAEPMEQRAGTKGNAGQQSTHRTQSRTNVSQAQERIRKAARERKKERFTALFHHITVELLEEAFYALAQNAAPGVDRRTWKDYEADLEHNIEDLHQRVQRGAYRALPSRRVYITKPDGQQRPLAVAALEDKIVQRAVVALLNAIYEEDFLGFSYGFRPGRGAHDALDALCVGIHGKKVSFIVDADIRSFFDTISQQWLIRFLEHRIGDRRIIRLASGPHAGEGAMPTTLSSASSTRAQKWLKAGILEDGVVAVSDRGTGQGSVISPLLANIYLHYALDAQRFLKEMRERLREFALSLHPEKTRLIEFGRLRQSAASGTGSASRRPSISWASPSSAARLVREDSRSNGKPAPTACGRSCRRSSRRCDGACTSQSSSRGGGWSGLSAATSTITPCQPMVRHWRCSGIMSLIFGVARCGVAVRRIG